MLRLTLLLSPAAFLVAASTTPHHASGPGLSVAKKNADLSWQVAFEQATLQSILNSDEALDAAFSEFGKTYTPSYVDASGKCVVDCTMRKSIFKVWFLRPCQRM